VHHAAGTDKKTERVAVVAEPGSAAPAQASEAQLSGEEQARYLADLKRLYLTKDERKALLAHSNALLDTYALRAGYQLGKAPAQRSDLRYQLSIAGPASCWCARKPARNTPTAWR